MNVFVITVVMAMLLRDFGTYGIIFMNVFSITIATVILLRDFRIRAMTLMV
jgi:hypothetical protein